jgi:hypothetical protein
LLWVPHWRWLPQYNRGENFEVGFTQSTSTATLIGTVTDASKGLIVSAAVRITDQETQLGRQIATDDAGFYRFDLLPPGTPNYQNPQAQQAGFEVHEFSPGFTTSATGIFVRGSHLPDAYDNNLPPNAPFDPAIGTQNYGPDATHPYGYFVNPLIYQSNVYESESNSFYGGLLLEGRKRLGRNVRIDANLHVEPLHRQDHRLQQRF